MAIWLVGAFACALLAAVLAPSALKHSEQPTPQQEPGGVPLARVRFGALGHEGVSAAIPEAHCVYLHRAPNGFPTVGDFGVATTPIPVPKRGDVVVRSLHISVDPYMRNRFRSGDLEDLTNASAPQELLPRIAGGENVGVVMEAPGAEIEVGALVRGHWGWCDAGSVPFWSLEKLAGHHKPASVALGVVGMPGRTAYHGVLDLLKPTKGDVVFVSGAHGAVGAVAGQLAKAVGATVIGSAGTAEKVRDLHALGFDGAFNYREEEPGVALDRLAPRGIDHYLDNTGGPVSEAVVARLKAGGRVAISGQIHWYNTRLGWTAPLQVLRLLSPSSAASAWNAAKRAVQHPIEAAQALARAATVHTQFPLELGGAYRCVPDAEAWHESRSWMGKPFRYRAFIQSCFQDDGRLRLVEEDIARLVQEGKVTIREDIVTGSVEDAPAVFIRMMAGANRGKQVLSLVADSASPTAAGTA